ncbi:type III polyketide synthase, partial [Cohnella panacarvi]|uniref:type III polyketide synthase n=1 Tax=Cohnella panacarvi TaxID=400776 RepID=UPI0004ACB049
MHLTIMGIGTAVPASRLEQRNTAERLEEALKNDPERSKWATRIFAHCGVETRYTCEPNLLESAGQCRYVPVSPEVAIPTTEERMRIYERQSVPLALRAATRALEDSRVATREITHLIVASCTGLFLPGLDAVLAQELDLPRDVTRVPLTFLGCAAGLTALREAARIARAEPAAKALVVAVELCTIHIQPTFDKEHLFTAAFFGDGASACVIGHSEKPSSGQFTLGHSRCITLPETSDTMKWTVGDYGFRLELSPRIPRIIGDAVPPIVETFWGKTPMPKLWAIHPGGRAIIDAVAHTFRLTDEQTEASRSVLREFGNMSSATILFVMDALRTQAPATDGLTEGIALAFGPGVVAELLRFSYRP